MPSTLTIPTPHGPLTLTASCHGLTGVRFGAVPGPDDAGHPVLAEAAGQITSYLSGRRATFDLPLDQQMSPFARAVTDAVVRVPYGTTVTYAALAAMAGRPSAVRAAASVMARNPLLLVVPCHRVIPSAGGVGRYQAGAEVKQALRNLEAGQQDAMYRYCCASSSCSSSASETNT